MKRIVFYIFTLVYLDSVSQQHSYYYNGSKINITRSTKYVNVVVNNNYTLSLDAANYTVKTIHQDDEGGSKILQVFIKGTSPSLYSSLASSLNANSNVLKICSYYERGNNFTPIGTSNLFYIKTKNNSTSYQKLLEYRQVYNYSIVREVASMQNWYILKLDNSIANNVIDVSSYLFETGHFDAIDPAFMFNFKGNCTNDPQFNNLWGLRNTGTKGAGIDISACQAWNISLGNSINVAVVDQGIDKNHEDLASNISPLSFNTITGSSPSGHVNIHGTYVAGIIGAVRNNNKGIVGVAPHCKLMSVSHLLNNSTTRPTLSAELASGINWAWQNGAHVINCSWGDWNGLYQNLRSAAIESAILNALNNGRSNLGSIVVFASGNTNTNITDYPGNSHPNILCVGSIHDWGKKSHFSSYGSALDVVAPGSDITSTDVGNSYTTEEGTSASAPFVSGLAALVLSVNNNLTGNQVRNFIEQSAVKIGDYNYSNSAGRANGLWNNQTGYGLINAYHTVASVQYQSQLLTCTPLNVHNANNSTNLTYSKCIINSQNTKINSNKTIFYYQLETNLNEFEVKNSAEFEIIQW